ncbi:MAG: sensor histidine kinase [Spirosomataceae bacterium]
MKITSQLTKTIMFFVVIGIFVLVGFGYLALKFLGDFAWICIILFAFFDCILVWLFIKKYIEKLLEPIRFIKEELDSIFPKNLEKRLFESYPYELGEISKSSNSLIDRIEGAFQLQQTFISNFSHELKNPLMKMVAQLELSIIKVRSHEEYEKVIKSVLEDLKELGQLSDTLLELVKVGDQARDFIPAAVRIDEILFDAREFLLESQKGCRIFIDFESESFTEEQLTVNGNAHLLRTAFVNIIENGCKFSYDGQVKVLCAIGEGEVKIYIINRGFGILKSDIPHLFDPFFRAERATTFKGYGIGLPLVHRIIKHHKGTIEVDSVENEETTFIIGIPFSHR